MDQPTNNRSRVLQALAWVGKVAVEGIAVAIALAFLAPVIADRVALANPTCNDPRGLRLVASSELRADGKAYPAEGQTTYEPRLVLDGNPGTLWMPPLDKGTNPRDRGEIRIRPGESSLTISFRDGKAQSVRLVCVVNGLANSPQRYRSWGRVRTVQTTTDVDAKSHIAVLRTLDDGSFQNGQEVRLKRGATKTIRLDVVDAYHGQIVEEYDPDICNKDIVANDPQLQWRSDGGGCIVNPQPYAGISEVQVYVWDGGGTDYLKTMLFGV